jgi:hypothetical protein
VQQQGLRLDWVDVPASVRRQVEAALGCAVVEAVNQPGGFSPGVAARCRLADGRRCFIKCVSAEQNPRTPDMHRREAAVSAALPDGLPVPRLLHAVDDGTWVTLVFEEIDGVPPDLPWALADLAATFRALDELAARTTPCPVAGLPSFAERHREAFAGFRRFAEGVTPTARVDKWTLRHLDLLASLESEWETAAAGDTLVHSDVRADNLLVRPDGEVVVVDWPHACVGAPWLDKLCMMPSVGLDGGPDPAEVDARLQPLAGVDAGLVNRVLVGLTGYFTHQGCLPDPPGLPTVRPFQRAQGAVARRWLAGRLDLA